MSLKRTIYRLSFRVFKLFSRAGLYILPAHYYVPIADINRLEKTKESWAVKSSLPGVHSDLDEQAARMKDICLPFQKEYEGNHTYKTAVNEHFGPGYGYIEAQALHGFLRHLRPKRIIEVGSGVSTFCMRHALGKNREEAGRTNCTYSVNLQRERIVYGLAKPPLTIGRTPIFHSRNLFSSTHISHCGSGHRHGVCHK